MDRSIAAPRTAPVRFPPALVAALCALALGACGGGSEGGDDPVSGPSDVLAGAPSGEDAPRAPVPAGAPRASIPVIGDESLPVERFGTVGVFGPANESEVLGFFSRLERPLGAAAYEELRRPALDVCTVATGSLLEIGLDDASYTAARLGPTAPLDAGPALRLDGPGGNWATVAGRVGIGTTGYGGEEPVTGPRPENLTLDVPGGGFPAMRVALPDVRPPENVSGGGDGEDFDYGAPFLWTPGDRPDAEWIALEMTAADEDDFLETTLVSCRLVDDGEFRLPREAADALDGRFPLDGLFERVGTVIVRDGDAALVASVQVSSARN